VHGSKTSVNGGGDQIYTDSASVDAVKLIGTAGHADNVYGNNTAIELDNAQAYIQGAADPAHVASGATNAISGSGGLAVKVDAGVGLSLTGSHDSISLGANASLHISSGSANVVTSASGDQLYDGGAATLFRVGGTAGALTIRNFGADPTGVIDLLSGEGGYATAAAAVGALVSDGAGGVKLSLGSAGSIDFSAVAPGHLSSANFRIG